MSASLCGCITPAAIEGSWGSVDTGLSVSSVRGFLALLSSAVVGGRRRSSAVAFELNSGLSDVTSLNLSVLHLLF